MKRVVALIAIIFAFASLAGTTMAHAHRYQSLTIEPLVVLNHVDAKNVALPVYVTVQRGEIDLGSGIMMPCGPHHAIVATAPVLGEWPACGTPSSAVFVANPEWPTLQLLRPPISA